MHEGIGGYFELELPDYGGFLHDDGVFLNSGRNALEYILRSLPDVRHIWIPYYTCEVILEPVRKLDIAYSFYRINAALEIRDAIDFRAGDYLLYTNYFGIKDQYVQRLADKFGTRLIVDNAQAWYSVPIPGISTFYSPRKYVGVPDGGIAFCPSGIGIGPFERDYSYGRSSHLLKRIDIDPSAGFSDYRDNSKSLVNQPIKRMSRLTERLLRAIDFDDIKQKRIENYLFLCERLNRDNLFCVPEYSSFACPMIYPFLTSKNGMRKWLIENGVFVATYWPNVLSYQPELKIEIGFTKRLLAIPCDQRYANLTLERVSTIIKDYI